MAGAFADRYGLRHRKVLIVACAALAIAAAMLRMIVLPVAPIVDPLEARELQLAEILVRSGWHAFAAALEPSEMGRIGGPLVAALGGVPFGFADLAFLRLPGYFVMLFAASWMLLAAYRLTGRSAPGTVAGAALLAMPATGLICFFATADAVNLLLLAVVLSSLAHLLRWGGDSWLDLPQYADRHPVLYDPQTMRGAVGEPEQFDDERSDLVAATWLWGAVGLGTWFSGVALPAFTFGVTILSILLFRGHTVRRHPLTGDWKRGTMYIAAGIVAVTVIAALPHLVIGFLRGEWGLAFLEGLLTPRPDASAYAGGVPGWWLAVLCCIWPLLPLLPLFLISRRHNGVGRETVVLTLIAVWAPAWSLVMGLEIGLAWGAAALALGAALLVNYASEVRVRLDTRHPESEMGPDAAWLAVGGLVAAGAVGCIVGLFLAAPEGDETVLAILFVAILLMMTLAYAVVERSAAGMVLSALLVFLPLDFAASGFVAPSAGKVWPDWRVEMALAPWRSCGAHVIADETGFDAGFLRHAGPGAVAPGQEPAQEPALLVTRDATPPGAAWIRVGSIGAAEEVHIHANRHGTLSPGADRRVWFQCIALLGR